MSRVYTAVAPSAEEEQEYFDKKVTKLVNIVKYMCI